MRASRLAVLIMLLIGASLLAAQVVSPVEISDPALRALQEKSISDLNAVGKNIAAIQFNFPFYLSRKLDIDERQQKRTDQSSIRFEHYNGVTVLAISGNYYGAYAADKFNEEQRERETFLDVVVPILRAAVPRFQGNAMVQGYAVEVSHHVINKTMGMPIERPENLMVYFPQSAAVKLVAAQNNLALQGALLGADVFLNAKQLDIWLTDNQQVATIESESAAPETPKTTIPPTTVAVADKSFAVIPQATNDAAIQPATKPTTAPAPPPQPPARDTSPQALATLQLSIQGASNHMLKELEPEAHFVTYAPPAFITFHHQVYLELSMTTILAEPPQTSRYKLAALAFDEHISPLIRRVLTYFPGDQNFDGISFSTTVRGRTKPGVPTAKPLAVEFFFPMESLRRYESYDCSGQQLINDGIVLINGERAGLDLELAQGSSQP
ncbi:MAG: hypothetical protein ABSF16_01290 [Terracidiphilus sp.]|jgi:hypothetical protein